MAYSAAVHFESIREIWEAFFAGQISMQKRDRLLDLFRARLIAEVSLLA